MNIGQAFKMAWRSICGKKGRSALTILSIFIGIAGGIATLVWLVQGFMNVGRGLRRPLSFIGEITLLK